MKKTAGRTTASGRVYQLHIALRGIRPPVWRRVQVPGTFTLARVHDVIQTVFGWTDSHLHQFYIDGATYGKPLDFDEAVLNETKTTLAKAAGASVKRFMYVYDFGDDWVHDVSVEKVFSGNSGSEVPVCLGGKRHRPPEDCGGVHGYREFLKAIRSPGHEEHASMLEWVGGSFDPEAFDLAFVNRALAGASHGLRRVQ
jgi:Plasmid pRiA4b ORF-3-like protein